MICICLFPESSKSRSFPSFQNYSRDSQFAAQRFITRRQVCICMPRGFAQTYYLKIRVNSAMPQSLDMPARITINTNMKTDTITTILSFTMLFSPGKFKDGPNHVE
jgi:hypothetical protein